VLLKKIVNRLLILLILNNIIESKNLLYILEYRPFPEEMTVLNFQPENFCWSLANNFILLDKSKNEIISLDKFGKISLSSSFGLRLHSFGELVWGGISPDGIFIVDRLNNMIYLLDYRMNIISKNGLEPRFFPDLGAIDPRGRVLLYSSQYNSVFSYSEASKIDRFIDLNRLVNTRGCIKDMDVNDEGELALLDCNGLLHLFTNLGRLKVSLPVNLDEPQFIAFIREKWFLFNKKGDGIDIVAQEKIEIPEVSIPILDLISFNRTISILSSDHILVLEVKSH
tara:strand:- start:95525 stop:96370 length:846 start_codon:yes stop_codon:yes gene_type:complete